MKRLNLTTLKQYFSSDENEIKTPSFLSDKLGKDILWSFSSMAVMGLAGILFHILILNLRGKEALGIFTQVYALYMISSQIAVGGIHLSILKSVSYHQDDSKQVSEIYTSGFLLTTLIAFLFCLIAYALHPLINNFMDSKSVALGFVYAIPGIFFFSQNKVLLNTLNGVRNIRALASFNIVRFTLILVAIIFIIFSDLPDHILPFALSFAEITMFIFLIIFLNVYITPMHISRGTLLGMKQHFRFGMKGFLTGMFTTVNTRVDVIMLGYFLEDAVVGIYGMVATVADGVYQISFFVRNNVDPILGKAFSTGKPESIRQTSMRIRKFFYPLMSFVGIIVVIGYPIAMLLMVGDESFINSWKLLAILLFGIVVSSGYKPFAGIFLQAGKPGTATLVMITLVLFNALLNITLIPLIGLYGAAIATASAYILEMILLIALSRILFKVKI